MSSSVNAGPTPNADHAARFVHSGRSAFSFWFKAIFALCFHSKLRSLAIRIICRWEGGQCWSATFRELMRRYYRVEIGLHSYGSCLWPGRLPEGTRVGNYCSLADGIVALRANHPVGQISQHPFFYRSSVCLVDPNLAHVLPENPLTVGHDVWIGMNVLIAPGCKTIGNGAVIAAGSVVTSNVPEFAIVGGVPAKLIRWRFTELIRESLTVSQWWLKPAEELAANFDLFVETASPEIVNKLTKTMR